MTMTAGADRVEHPIGPSGRFQLRLPSGSVEVRGVDGDLARVVELSGRPLADVFRIEAAEGSLSLLVRDGSIADALLGMLRDDASADLAVELPTGAAAAIETTNAEINVHGLTGPGRYRTTSGDLAFEEVAGTLDIGSVSGDVELDGAGALDLRVRTVSGEVDLRAPSFRRLGISTTSGDVDVDGLLSGPGPFAIQTVSGDAEIVGRSGMTIEARTVTGDLETELPHRSESRPGRKTLVVGGGEVRLSFQSVSGDLEVTEPRGDLPAESVVAALSADPATAWGTASDGQVAGGVAAPVPPAAPAISSSPAPGTSDAARMAVLRALERGEIGVEEAGERLARLEEE